jgi:RimJ/RimL family protein N-acetyltransferase
VTFTPNLPVATERLTLRFTEPTDAEAMVAYKARPESVRYVPYPPLSLGEINERLSNDGRWSKRRFMVEGDVVSISLIETASGQLVGDVVLIWVSEIHKVIEIGYILAPEFRGRGYATEASLALLAIAFDQFDAHRVVATVDERNTPSFGVLERLGMRCEARHVSDHWSKGEWVSTRIYAITEDEWRVKRTSLTAEHQSLQSPA